MTADQAPKWAREYAVKEIVTRADAAPAFESLAPYARPKVRPGAPFPFAVHVIAEPTSGQGKRGVIISPRAGYANWEVYCDEGTTTGGKDEAPSPLGYMTMGVAFCLLTHVTGYLERYPMDITRLKVELRAEFATLPPEPESGGQGVGRSDGFTCHVIIDSDEPADRIAKLIEVCQSACMAMQTLAHAIPTATTVVHNGQHHDIAAL